MSEGDSPFFHSGRLPRARSRSKIDELETELWFAEQQLVAQQVELLQRRKAGLRKLLKEVDEEKLTAIERELFARRFVSQARNPGQLSVCRLRDLAGRRQADMLWNLALVLTTKKV